MFQTVLVTGVFDVLHFEHVMFLCNAKKIGRKLLVGIESDVRVKQLKGPTRPINTEQQRLANLQKLGIADQLLILPESFSQPQEHLKLLRQLQPDVLAVSEHTAHLEEKRRLMAKIGGVVQVVHPHNPHVSTTLQIASSKTNIIDEIT